jgi:thioredoxin 1
MLPTVTDASFGAQVLHAELPVLVKFTASWCQPCKTMTDILRDFIPEMGNHVRFVEVDIEANPELSNLYQVRSLPTLVLFKKGAPIANITGLSPKPKIRSWIINQLGL